MEGISLVSSYDLIIEIGAIRLGKSFKITLSNPISIKEISLEGLSTLIVLFIYSIEG